MTEKSDFFLEDMNQLTPREIVSELDRYVIGQHDAKRAVAIALRNRWRRLKVEGEMREEITPKNIIMIGSTGVGKTEIARRLAKLANSPFLKVEASKFTEVGYVGKDVESMVRDLVEISVRLVKEKERERVRVKAEELAEERLLDLLLPKPKKDTAKPIMGFDFGDEFLSGEKDSSDENKEIEPEEKSQDSSREKMRKLLREGKLADRKVELDIDPRASGGAPGMPMIEVISAGGSLDEITNNIRDMMGSMAPSSKKKKKLKVSEALEILTEDEQHRLIDMENVAKLAVEKVENNGIIFIDEIDKIATSDGASRGGPEVSRQGVQRDILPIIEGSTVSTKYGFVKTNHILFIAAGAFHMSKPSDLIPELQGRFPIRVELDSLTKDDFLKILTEPKNSLIKQYTALMGTEKVDLKFSDDALTEVAGIAADANEQMENIGARRLHTILEKVMDEISFDATDKSGQEFQISGEYVRNCLSGIIQDQDLRRFIL